MQKRIKYSFKLTDFLEIKRKTISLSVGVAAASQSAGKHDPMFISRSETFKFVAGETIHLPCEVSNTGKYIFLSRSVLSLLGNAEVYWYWIVRI